jgi:hypothetical protein
MTNNTKRVTIEIPEKLYWEMKEKAVKQKLTFWDSIKIAFEEYVNRKNEVNLNGDN